MSIWNFYINHVVPFMNGASVVVVVDVVDDELTIAWAQSGNSDNSTEKIFEILIFLRVNLIYLDKQ